jgi:hypothetical protein
MKYHYFFGDCVMMEYGKKVVNEAAKIESSENKQKFFFCGWLMAWFCVCCDEKRRAESFLIINSQPPVRTVTFMSAQRMY